MPRVPPVTKATRPISLPSGDSAGGGGVRGGHWRDPVLNREKKRRSGRCQQRCLLVPVRHCQTHSSRSPRPQPARSACRPSTRPVPASSRPDPGEQADLPGLERVRCRTGLPWATALLGEFPLSQRPSRLHKDQQPGKTVISPAHRSHAGNDPGPPSHTAGAPPGLPTPVVQATGTTGITTTPRSSAHVRDLRSPSPFEPHNGRSAPHGRRAKRPGLARISAGVCAFSLTFPITQRYTVYQHARCRPSTRCGMAGLEVAVGARRRRERTALSLLARSVCAGR